MDVGIRVLLMALGAWALAAFSAWRCRELYRSGRAYWSAQAVSGQVIGERINFPVWFRGTLVVVGAIGCVLAFAAAYFTIQLPQAFSAGYRLGDEGVQALAASTSPKRRPHTLREIFQQDFDHTRRTNRDLIVTPVPGWIQQAQVTVQGRLYLDFDAMAKFIGVFVPMSAESPAMLVARVADHVETILSWEGHAPIEGGGLGAQQTDSGRLKFSGRVYVYHEGPLSVREKADLHDVYRRKGLSLELRGSDYAPVVAAFEVVSIKPARSGDPRHMRMRVLPNGDLNASAVPVPLLLRYAYDVPINPSPRLSGLPGWRETYDIEAKAPANAVPSGLPESEKRDRTQGMIRGLLADRFKLVMRVEQKAMLVYALSVASGGPNLQKATIAEKDCMFDTGTPKSCHHFVVGRGHPLNARAVTMDDLARYIENWADLPVVNRTALSGLFAVTTEGWTPMRLPPPPPGNPSAARFDDLPTIFTVLRKLGLELKQQKGTVPVYTVEHIERPEAE